MTEIDKTKPICTNIDRYFEPCYGLKHDASKLKICITIDPQHQWECTYGITSSHTWIERYGNTGFQKPLKT